MSIHFVARVATALAVMAVIPSLTQAASMTGSLYMGNPGVPQATRYQVRFNQTVGTTGTGTARSIMLPAHQWDQSGLNQRIFAAFPSVAQNTEVYTTTHNAVTFGPGLGAGTITWCPSFTGCPGYTAGTVAQGLIGVIPGANTFGGAFRLLRHLRLGSGAWFIANPGTATPTKVALFNPNLRGVTVTAVSTGGRPTGTADTFSSPWSAGITNHLNVTDVNPFNQLWANNFLSASGGIQTLGSFVSTSTGFDPPDGFATGFKMTTGTVYGTDPTPVTSMGAPFTFTEMGYDNRDASGNGNIQLVGGAVAYGGVAGQLFFRATRLRMAVPEPTSGLALAAGVLGFSLLAGLRRRKQS